MPPLTLPQFHPTRVGIPPVDNWHDGLGMSLYAKRLERGRFIWPSPADGIVAITPSQLAYMLDGIDWRNPRHTFRPERAG
jgi:transposase